MCGIVALFAPETHQRTALARAAIARIRHRGDADKQDEGVSLPAVHLTMNRMQIASRVDARQPVTSDNGAVTVIFNGEIYNYRELAARYNLPQSVIAAGDTSVLAELLALKKDHVLDELEGMFAFIAFDHASHSLFAARDHIGIKPLYYARYDAGWMLTSEIKAFAGVAGVTDIDCLAPGQCMVFQGDAVPAIKTWYTPSHEGPAPAAADIRTALTAAVKDLSVYDDGPIALFLSGGVDSGALLALAHAQGITIDPIVVGTPSSPDVQNALFLCDHFGITPRHLPIEHAAPAPETIRDIIWHLESFETNLIRTCIVHDSLCRYAADSGYKVILCGEGADELFGGYSEFANTTADNWQELRQRYLTDLHRTQLQRVDRMGMAYTTEIRVPYLTRRVMDLALGIQDHTAIISGNQQKVILRDALARILPDRVRLAPKQVFSEGAGVDGVRPQAGKTYEFIDGALSDHDSAAIIAAYPAWRLSTKEDAYYFSIFREFGFDKAGFMKNRITATRQK